VAEDFFAHAHHGFGREEREGLGYGERRDARVLGEADVFHGEDLGGRGEVEVLLGVEGIFGERGDGVVGWRGGPAGCGCRGHQDVC